MGNDRTEQSRPLRWRKWNGNPSWVDEWRLFSDDVAHASVRRYGHHGFWRWCWDAFGPGVPETSEAWITTEGAAKAKAHAYVYKHLRIASKSNGVMCTPASLGSWGYRGHLNERYCDTCKSMSDSDPASTGRGD